MDLLGVCGTWIKGYHELVVQYIESCDVFPNIGMIAEATGVPESRIRRTISMMRQQESLRVQRLFLLEANVYMKEYTSKERLICTYLLQNKHRNSMTDQDEIHAFMNRHRYYDNTGMIRYRFSELDVQRAMQLYNALSPPLAR